MILSPTYNQKNKSQKMKCATYLALSTLMVGTASSATLRGAEDEMSATPREFQVHSNTIESSSTHHTENRIALENCNSEEELLQVAFTPDRHSDGDNEFTISIKQNGKWSKLAKQSGELDEEFSLCLSPGYHRFEAIDSHSDGISDDGYYKVSLGGRTIFRSPDGEWSRVVHKFDVLGGSYNNDKTTDDEDDENDDEEREESEPELLAMMPQATEFPTMVLASTPNSSPSSPTTKNPTPRPTTKTPTPRPTTNEPTLVPTTLEPTPTTEEITESSFTESSTQEPTDAPTSQPSRRPTQRPTPRVTSVANVSTGEMTEREEKWLEEHNVRRELYHTQRGKTYKPLKWSAFLKDSAQTWAEECARTGVFDHAWHLDIGENMARHTTNGDGYRHPSNILTRWVENELDAGYPANGHLTQVLWWATEYVGCGEARNGNRYYQVCQYSKPGNCAVNQVDFWSSVMADDSGCDGMPLLY